MDNIALAFLVTTLAGLSTGIGGLFAFNKRTNNKKFLSFALGLSAGVMIYVSFVEIFPKAFASLTEVFPEQQAYLFTTIAFFVGVGLIAMIDYFIPNEHNPHEIIGQVETEAYRKKKLMRLGVFTAVAIAIHNFPEGLATFIATLDQPQVGIAIAVAIAIHNIPEGIAVAIPIYFATQSKRKAIFWSFLSGLAEPLGALIGFVLLWPFINGATFGFVFAGVAGIMVYISVDELLPAAEKYGEHHISISGLITGMVIMALSLVLLY
jgi:zinc transporter, ZIP family